jgi:hypothetical protein
VISSPDKPSQPSREASENVGDQAWHRPTIFAASDRQHDVAEKLVRALIRRGTRIAKIIVSLCDASVTYLDSDLRDRVTKLRDDFLPPKNLEEAQLLATLGDAIVDRRLRCKRPKATAHACSRTLRLIGTAKAKDALRGYWETDQQDIAEELAQIFHPLAIPFWQRRIQQDPQAGGEPNLPESVAQAVYDLAPLAGLAGLRTLWLTNTAVADLAPLAGLAGLRTLSLGNTAVADVSVLDHIEGLKILR